MDLIFGGYFRQILNCYELLRSQIQVGHSAQVYLINLLPYDKALCAICVQTELEYFQVNWIT